MRKSDGRRCEGVDQQRTVRCAIYTRKSTDEGLSQDFNSLDAQREAAEAYVTSQRNEGWIVLPTRYDDGGYTGANLDRPAMRRLIADVEKREIDCVVIYKIDRLSRSLVDFAKLIELFESHGTSLVSITQQLATNTSMGRLTMNILSSFAQFERELIAERTRDKMSAARRKGKWIGGIPVLGYDVDPRGGRLIVNQDEARRVRAMFDLYLQHRALIPTVRAINAKSWTTKQWTTKEGREHRGNPITKNLLFRMLTNPLYAGKVRHKGQIFDGEHEAIVDAKIWKQVNDILQGRNGSRAEKRNKHAALLRGLLYCEPCQTAMLHTFTTKGNRLYRYYACLRKQQQGTDACQSNPLSAHDIESAVIDRIRGLGANSEVARNTIREIKLQLQRHREEVSGEVRATEKERVRLNQNLDRLASLNGSAPVERITELQNRLRDVEQRAGELQKEAAAAERESVNEADVLSALKEFDGIWGALTTAEQVRLVRLLIGRVDYNGTNGRVAVVFRSTALKAMCDAAMKGAVD